MILSYTTTQNEEMGRRIIKYFTYVFEIKLILSYLKCITCIGTQLVHYNAGILLNIITTFKLHALVLEQTIRSCKQTTKENVIGSRLAFLIIDSSIISF